MLDVMSTMTFVNIPSNKVDRFDICWSQTAFASTNYQETSNLCDSVQYNVLKNSKSLTNLERVS